MSSPRATETDVLLIERILADHDELAHLRVRRRGSLLTVVSGPDDDPVPHVRFRRLSQTVWAIEMPDHRGRWERTGLHGPLEEAINLVISEFSWTLAPIWEPNKP